jgi:hypothetical protein
MRFSIPTVLPLNASPQILSLGKTALSIIICDIFSLLKNRDVLAPAGPAPAISTSVI